MPDSSDSDSAWRSLHETHLANLRSHRALLDHLASLHRDSDNPELDAMRARAERIWEDAVRAGEIMMGKTTATSAGRRRISSGFEVSAPGSPDDEEGEDGEREGDEDGDKEEEADDEEVGGNEGAADVDDRAEKRIVIANIPPGVTASEVWQLLGGYNPVKLKHPIRPPKRPEILLYALPAGAPQDNGFVKVVLRSAASAACAIRDLNGLRWNDSSNEPYRGITGSSLIVCRYRAAALLHDDDAASRAKNKKRLRCVSSGENLAQQQQQHERKRQRMDSNTGNERSGPTSNGAATTPTDTPAAASTTYVFTFTPAGPQQQPPPAPPAAAAEPEPEFEDISAEVEIRLAEQAARRAIARQKMSGTAGKKRGRLAGQMEVEVEGDDEAAIAGMAGMALVDRRPRKMMREERVAVAADAEDDAARVERDEGRQQQPQANGFPTAKARVRKERRKAVREREGRGEDRTDESSRPTKRSRKSM